jgi:hypothetical protein
MRGRKSPSTDRHAPDVRDPGAGVLGRLLPCRYRALSKARARPFGTAGESARTAFSFQRDARLDKNLTLCPRNRPK